MDMSERFAGRVEDERLITGKGVYSDDFNLPGQAYAVFLRSPMAHADIEHIDVSAALTAPGVLAVLTGADLKPLNYGQLAQYSSELRNADGTPIVIPDWPPLAMDRVRFAGEPLALVVAESPGQALDASEAIDIGYSELPCAVATERAAEPAIWAHAPDNVALDYEGGDAHAATRAFSAAAHIVSARIVSQRLVVNPMEPRACVAAFDADTDRYELYAGSQGAATLRDQVAGMMHLPKKETLRVVSRDVGGGFGCKTHAYPEYVALLEAARRLGRPIKWNATRSESFLSDTQGRDSLFDAELALDANGRFLGVRAHSLANVGAYLNPTAAFIATSNVLRCLASVYLTPAFHLRVQCIYTNTVPVAPYRGAGRPEANLVMERLVELAARKLGIDRAELRRRNLVPAAAMPYKAPNGITYDSGEFEAILDRALELADFAGFEQRKAAARRRGCLRGIGIGCYLEVAGGPPLESLRLDVQPDGRVTVRSGLQSNGQGHATVLPNLVASALGFAPARIALAESDTDALPTGTGTFGSRSLTVGAAAVAAAVARLIDKARELAASTLEVAESDITYADGVLRVAGTDRSVTIGELAERHGSLSVVEQVRASPTFPNGCHITEVEVDQDTGVAHVPSHVAVSDIGVCIDRTLATGQIHGGIAQGLGQVFLEHGHYDPSSGQLLSGSFADYALPRADNLPDYRTEFREVRCRTNAAGTKGAGEAGTTGALAAGYNALMDALHDAGIDAFDMPATPAKVWNALHSAAASRGK